MTLRPFDLNQNMILLISYPGELFMRILKLIILPLIITSLIAGTSSLNAKMNGHIAVRTLIFFMTTSLYNSIMGTILAVLIKPGKVRSYYDNLQQNHTSPLSTTNTTGLLDSLLDLGRNLVPDNLFQATFQSTQTFYVSDPLNQSINLVRKVQYRSGTNTLGLVFFCILFGTVLGCIGERGKNVADFFSTIFQVIMKMVTGIMWLTPFGILLHHFLCT